MAFLGSLMATHRCINIIHRQLLFKKKLHIFAQAALNTFEGEDIISLFVPDLLRDITLATYGVNSDDGTFDLKQTTLHDNFD